MSHAELWRRHRAVMPAWLSLYYDQPISLERGSGRHVWDKEGHRYLDLFGGILTTMTAHALPEVVEAVRSQAGRMVHTSTSYLIEPAIELAEMIAELAPVPDAKVFFTTSGTEANEAALLLACTVRRSNQIIALRNSYHGRSFAAMAVTGNRGWSASSLSPLSVSYVHGGYRHRSPFRDLDDDRFIAACTDDLRNIIETTTAGDVACMIAEPIQGVGGFTVPPDGLFASMQEVLDEYGILLVSDEVQTGWGRTGDHFWGIDAHGARPDIVTFAKGIANGLPLAGVIAPAEIMDSVTANSISTFGGNPLSAAAGLANLRYLLDHDLQGNARRVGGHLIEGLRAMAGSAPGIAEVRGRGLMIGVELVEAGSDRPDPAAAAAAQERCRQQGVLVGRGGLYGNVLRVAPPMSITVQEADEGLAALRHALLEDTPQVA